MTYSRMRMHTTIGAGSFHFRVREGIGWYQTAMAARETLESRSVARTRRCDLGCERVLGTSRVNVLLRLSEASWSYMIKPHGSLVVVSSALLRYTPTLSTR